MSGILLRNVLDDVLLGELVESRAGKTPSRSESSYWGGSIPWLTAKDLKTHRLSSSIECITPRAVQNGAPLAAPGDVLILVRGMTLLKDVPLGVVEAPISYNQDVRCLRPRDGHSGEYLAYLLLAAKDRLLGAVTQAGHGTGRLDGEQLMSVPLRVPPTHVQMWLVERLRPVERVIDTLNRLLAAKRALKRGLMQELLTGRRRFPEFSGAPWKVMPLSEFFQEKQVRNRVESLNLVLSCSKIYGIVPQSKRFKKRIASKSVANYKVVAPGDLVYDPMLLWDASIGFVPEPYHGVVSPAYATFEFHGERGCRSFLAQALFTHAVRYQYRVVSRGTNVRRKKAMPEDFLRIKIAVPPTIEEQKHIGSFFATLNREITLLEAQRAQFELQKRALMQKLLSGEVEIPADLAER